MRHLRKCVAIVGLAVAALVASDSHLLRQQHSDKKSPMIDNIIDGTTGGKQVTGERTSPKQESLARSGTDLHLVTEVTAANYEREVIRVREYAPVMIWLVTAKRAALFERDAAVMEQMAEVWQGHVKFVRVDATRVMKGSPLDEELGVSRGKALIYTLTQYCDQDLHHHELWLKGLVKEEPLTLRDIHGDLLNFKPDCPRSRCPQCTGEPILGFRPVAWR